MQGNFIPQNWRYSTESPPKLNADFARPHFSFNSLSEHSRWTFHLENVPLDLWCHPNQPSSSVSVAIFGISFTISSSCPTPTPLESRSHSSDLLKPILCPSGIPFCWQLAFTLCFRRPLDLSLSFILTSIYWEPGWGVLLGAGHTVMNETGSEHLGSFAYYAQSFIQPSPICTIFFLCSTHTQQYQHMCTWCILPLCPPHLGLCTSSSIFPSHPHFTFTPPKHWCIKLSSKDHSSLKSYF